MTAAPLLDEPILTTWSEVDLDVDLDAEVPCDVDGCDRRAAWRGRMFHLDGSFCCGLKACSPHKVQIQYVVQATLRGNPFMVLFGITPQILCMLHADHLAGPPYDQWDLL